MAQLVVTGTDAEGNAESVTIEVVKEAGGGQVYEIDALTAPWSNQAAGSTPDQTAHILAQIAAVPDGVPGAPNVIRFPVGKSQGKYYTQGDLANNPRGINGVFLLLNRNHLIIEGPSPTDPATFYTTSPAVPWGDTGNNQQSRRRHWWFQSCNDITFRNIRVEGSNYTFGQQLSNGNPFFWLGTGDSSATPLTRGYKVNWELEHAFEFSGCTGVLFEDCSAQDVWGDGLTLGSGPIVGPTTQFVGRRFSIVGSGRQGIALTRCADVLLDGLQIGINAIRPRRSGVDLEPVLNWVVERVEIANVDMWHHTFRPVAAKGSSRVDDIYLHDWWVHQGNGVPVIHVGASDGVRRKNWKIERFRHDGGLGSTQAALRFDAVDNVTVAESALSPTADRSQRCIEFRDCLGDLIVRDNTWGGGCWIDYTATSSVPQLQGFNTFWGTCVNPGLRVIT